MNPINDFLNEFTYSDVETILKSVPDVDRNEFISKLQVGDIILSQLNESYVTDDISSKIGFSIFNVLLHNFQRSPYSSSKLYIGNGKLIGYGAIPIEGDHSVKINRVKNWVQMVERACVVRPINISDQQKNNVRREMIKSIGMSYRFSKLVTTLFKRIRDKLEDYLHISRSTLEEEEKTKTIDILSNPTICSVIIAAAFKKSGYKFDFGRTTIDEVWPVDFILSNSTEKIVKFGGLPD